MNEHVMLVNKHDHVIGQEEKLKAHQTGALHRAFSIFIFNQQKQLLIQKRATTKYHSAGLWSNTCCGHPRPGEATSIAAQRRLFEETGIVCQLYPIGAFTYHAKLPQTNLIEYEVDHLFYGFFEGTPLPNPQEIAQLRWITHQQLLQEFDHHPSMFTTWFEQALQIIYRMDRIV
jgi:isopentenyl-diphosphate delta-isomerase